eukprot:362495-Pyramimonas_sp.AAC.1
MRARGPVEGVALSLHCSSRPPPPSPCPWQRRATFAQGIAAAATRAALAGLWRPPPPPTESRLCE